MNEFDKAIELLNITPQPGDIIEQLNALRKTVDHKFLILFDHFYEAAEASG